MKKFLPILALAAASLSLTGCDTTYAVNNKDDSNGSYQFGAATMRYRSQSPEYINNVFNATNQALTQLGYFRTGETPGKDKVTVFARAVGDVEITVDIYKKVLELKDGSKQDWIYVTVRYGTWGNLKESQSIQSKISQNLGVSL